MLETSRFEKLELPLKWGFIADSILLLLDHPSTASKLLDKDRRVLKAAIELLSLLETGIENQNLREVRNGLGQVVESLKLYNYVANSALLAERAPTNQLAHIKSLREKLGNWEGSGRLEETDADALRQFFKPISEVTLRESSELMTHRRRFKIPE